MVRRQSTAYLAGPPLLKAATGEVADEESIGGAEMHAGLAGTANYLAEDDRDGIRIAREIVGALGWAEAQDRSGGAAPQHSAEELPGIVPVDPKTPYDVREIIARIADASEFLDFKPDYDAGTVCGHASLCGHACGIIGTTRRSPRPAPPRPGSSCSCASNRARRCCSCTTPPAFWWARSPRRACAEAARWTRSN